MRNVAASAALAMVAGLATTVHAIGPEVIFAGVASAPASKREVPGLPGINFTTASTTTFDRMFVSPNGQHWAFNAFGTTATTMDEVVILVTNGVPHLVAQEGTPTPFDGTRNWGIFDPEVGVNDSGTIAFATNIDTSTATTDDELIAKFVLIGGVPTFDSLPFREGQPAPDAGVTSFVPAGATFGAAISDPFVLANGDVCAIAQFNTLTGQITTANDMAVYKGGVALHREGTTGPASWGFNWQVLNFSVYTPDGAHHVIEGDDTNATTTADDLVTVDDAVVIQAGQIIPGLTTPVGSSGAAFVWITPNGDWIARGINTNADEDWVVRNGVVLANGLGGATRDITPNNPSGELWDDATFTTLFYMNTGNSLGDYIIGGVTNGPTPSNGVLVLNGSTVVAREGDPIDLDGNGVYDDNVYIRTFGDDTGFLTDDGWFYTRLSLTDNQSLGGTGPLLGSVVVRIAVPITPPGCYANCDNSTTAPVLNVGDFTCFLQRFAAGEGYANCDNSTTAPVLNVGDFTCFLQQFAAGCP